MTLKVRNYDDWEENRPDGKHPAACSCFRCNEARIEQRKAAEEDQRAAEYERRVAVASGEAPAASGAGARAASRSAAHNRNAARNRKQSANPHPPTSKLRVLLLWLLIGAVGAGIGGAAYVGTLS